jgi:hypothetical protein
MASVSVAFVSFNESRNLWTCLLRVATLKAVHSRFFRDDDWKLISNSSMMNISSCITREHWIYGRLWYTYCNFDTTMVYSLYRALAKRVLV